MKNLKRPDVPKDDNGVFISVKDKTTIYKYVFNPTIKPRKTIYLLSGITGINHHNERNIIKLLSGNKNRVVVIHPRGTGYSEGSSFWP